MKHFTFLVLSIFLAGCGQKQMGSPVTQPPSSVQIQNIEKQQKELAAHLEYLDKELLRVDHDINSHTSQLGMLWPKIQFLKEDIDAGPSCYIDIRSTATVPLRSTIGTFFVKCESVELYGDGLRVHLAIGNPLNMDVSGIKMTCVNSLWLVSTKSDKTNSVDALIEQTEKISKSTHTNIFQPEVTIHAGSWSHFDIVFPRCKAEDLESLRIDSFQAQTVQLMNR